MSKSITVELETGAIEVKKLPLGKYAELLNALDQLPKQLAGFDGFSTDEFIAKLPAIISSSLPEVMKIIAVAADLTEEQVAELGLDETVELFVAIFEVNKVSKVVDAIKKLAARPAATE